MKKNLLLFIAFASFVSVSAQTNLVQNGDFEEWNWINANPVDWNRHISADVEKSTDVQSGDYSVKMESNGVAYIETSKKMSLKAEKTYVCTFHYKITKGSLFEFDATLLYMIGMWPESAITETITEQTPDVWHKQEFTYTETSDKEVTLRIRFKATGGDLAATVLVDNVSLIEQSTSAIESEKIESIVNVYPNPASEYIVLDTKGIDLVNIYDLNGKLAKSVNTVSVENNQINISSLPAGIYVLNFSKDGVTNKAKFVKQ